jgi:hypothetical protein
MADEAEVACALRQEEVKLGGSPALPVVDDPDIRVGVQDGHKIVMNLTTNSHQGKAILQDWTVEVLTVFFDEFPNYIPQDIPGIRTEENQTAGDLVGVFESEDQLDEELEDHVPDFRRHAKKGGTF